MTDLIARIESADGPDREIDAELMAIAHAWKRRALSKGSHYRDWCWVNRETGKWVTTARQGYEFTASIDAALTLVPEGWSYVIRPGYVELRHPCNPTRDIVWRASNTALALAAAALKARGV